MKKSVLLLLVFHGPISPPGEKKEERLRETGTPSLARPRPKPVRNEVARDVFVRILISPSELEEKNVSEQEGARK